MQIKTFGPVDPRSLEQLQRCMAAGDADYGVLCADHHPGYSQPIGGGIAYEGYVSPSGVGFDIGCGNKAARTDLTRADLDALPGWAEFLGNFNPLHHCVELVRHAEFGWDGWTDLARLGAFVVFGLTFWRVAIYAMTRKLID